MKDDVVKRLQSLALTLQEGWGRECVQDAINQILRMDDQLNWLVQEIDDLTNDLLESESEEVDAMFDRLLDDMDIPEDEEREI